MLMKLLIKITTLYALLISSALAENFLNLAEEYESKGNYAAAISNYINAINNAPGNYKLYNRVGLLYEKLSNSILSKDYFVRSIIVNNEYIEGYYNLGLWYYNRAKYDEAIINFKRALAISQSKPEIYINLINCYIKSNNVDSCMKFLEMALKMFPENYEILNLAGIVYMLKANYDLAIKHFRKALNKKEDDKIINNLGIALYLSGKKDEAKKLLTNIKKYDKIEENIKLLETGGRK